MRDSEDMVGRIYEAATVPSLWPDILRKIGCRANAPAGLIVTSRTVNYSGIRVSPSRSNSGLDAFTKRSPRAAAPPRLTDAIRAGFMSNHVLLAPAEYDSDPRIVDDVHL